MNTMAKYEYLPLAFPPGLRFVQLVIFQPLTGSDCESIIPLYLEKGEDFLNDLRGMFAFIIYDKRNDSFFAARDHIGIIPLYIGWGDDGSIWIGSEMKVLLTGRNSSQRL